MANANSTIEIELEIKQALDRLNKMQRELQKQADQFDKAGRASEKFERAVKASMSGAGSAIRKALGAFTSLQAAVVGLASAYSAKEFIEFGAAYEREISKLNALTKATAEEQLLLRAAIREVGSSTAYTATQAAEAANVLAALGRSSQQITKELGVVVRVAGATSTEIELVAEAVAAQVNVFELSAKTVGDIFAAAYSTSAANVERLQIALAQVGPVAKAAGLDLYETVGAISFLVDRGFEASSAGTAIRGALTRLIDPSKEVEKVFTELGVSLLQIQKLSFEDQLQLIADKLQNVSTQAERNRILTQIFGVEALAAANNLVEAYGRGNRVLTEQAEKLKAATDAATLYDKITSDLRGAIDSLIAAVQDKLLTAFQTLEPLIKGVVDDLTKSISDLTTLDVVNAVGRLGKFLLTVAEEFYNAIRLAINSISQFLNSSQFSQLMDLAGRALSSLGFTSIEEDIARQEAVFFEALANYRSARADLERMQQELDPQDEGAQIQIASAQQIVDRYQQIMVQEHQRFLLMKAQAEKLREQYELLGPQDDAFARANQRLEEGIQHITERVQETEKLIAKQKEANETAPGAGVTADQVAAQIARATEEPLDRMTEKVQLASLATQRLADIINSDLSGPDKISQLEALSQAILDAVDPADFVALGVEADDVYIKLIRLSESADQVAQNLRKTGEQEIQQQGFLAAQQAMKELLRLGEEEKRQRQEVADIIAGINLRGVETNEIEKLNKTYAAEITAIMLNTNYTLSQRVEIANALKDARDREAEGLEEALSFQEMITEELQTQLGLSESAASAAVSGYFGAGPSASRAGNILQSKSLEEAAYKLIFSNEKVASAINEQFEMLFDLIDPLIDILADLQSAINRLIKALLNAGQGLLDTVGLGQDSYLFGGGFAKDIESLFGGSRAPRGPSATENLLAAASENLTSETTVEALQASFDRYGSAAIDQYLTSIDKERQAILSLTGAQQLRMEAIREELEVLKEIRDPVTQAWVYGSEITALTQELTTLTRDYNQALSGFNNIATLSAAIIDDLLIPSIEGVVDKIINYADPLLADFAEQAGAEALAAQERISVGQALIQYRNDEQLALIETQRALAEYITDLEEKTRILGELSAAEQAIIELNQLQIQQFTEASNALTDSAISDIERRGLVLTEQQEIEYRYAKEIAAAQENTNLTTADQIRLVNALEAARQREIDALEREADLLRLTNLQQALISLFDDFEEGLVQIREVVDGLIQQVQDLIFSEFNLDPVRDKLSLASESYQDLLAKALDPDATEEDIQSFQQFVNTYLTSARDVFKSSTAYRDIFDQVLSDLQSLGLAYGENAPINLIEDIQEQLRSLEVEFGENLQVLIDELDRLATAFRSQSLEFDGSINVDLGSINVEFDSTPFLNAINQLNIDIASAINALIATIGDASDAITDTGGGGTVTPTPITEMIGPYGAGSQYSSVSGFDPLQKTFITTASGGKIQLLQAMSDLSGTDVNQLIQTMVEAQLTEYGTAADVIAKQSYAVVYGNENGQQKTIVYGAEAKSDLESFISNLTGSGYEYLGGYNFQLPSIEPAPTPTPSPTPAPPASMNFETIFWDSNSGRFLVVGASNKTASQIFSAFDGVYNSPFPYHVVDVVDGIGEIFGTNNIDAANSAYGSVSSNPYSDVFGKFGFGQGGLVPDPMDTIPAMLSPGEYILSPETVRRFGVGSLNQLNSGDASAISQTNDPEVKQLLAELILAVRESDTEVNVYTDMRGQAKAAVEEFRSEIKERSRRQGDQFIPVRYI